MTALYDGEFFEPKATLTCGQVFRYRALSEQDYLVYSGDTCARVFRKGSTTYVDTDAPQYFERYFDSTTDYGAITERLKKFPELACCIDKGKGIRILKQQLVETVLGFIISANNNIPRIQSIIERLCNAFGADKGGFHAFPTLEELKDVGAQTYRALGCGFRDRYLCGTVKILRTTDMLSRLGTADTLSAGELLTGLPGVGRKVADCILLFGLGRTDCYPVDTWIFKANRSAQNDTPRKVRDYCLQRYGKDAGYAQQYLFYATR